MVIIGKGEWTSEVREKEGKVVVVVVLALILILVIVLKRDTDG